ncbi:MAG: hypothetical protein K2K15_03480, partial [Anaeroplasmataceae bacterium]|nr:hypothetical protein [Anaeroplasmataceae bacterium]
MKKKILLIICLFSFFICSTFIEVDARNKYGITSTTLYFPRELETYFKTLDNVYKEGDRRYIYSGDFVNGPVPERRLGCDIDSVIYMLQDLETLAKKEAGWFDNPKNMVLGYLRSLKNDYADGYTGAWNIIAGDIDEGFVRKANSDTTNGIRFNEFFAQFLDYDKEYNSSLHGELDIKYRRSKDKNAANPVLHLIDPQNPNKKIDLIHMFAAMDGIYDKTGTKQTLGHRNMHKDIASWNGDLQQAAKALKNSTDIYEDFELNYETSNFYDIMNASKLGCSEDDILADIDAMNITKLFVDIDENGIADSVAAYYRIAKKYRFRRFTLFMYTATMELEFDDKNP